MVFHVQETDDIISRDIHRTFPEHPQFGCKQGQQMLFRVLKAYSLHDLEVDNPLKICALPPWSLPGIYCASSWR